MYALANSSSRAVSLVISACESNKEIERSKKEREPLLSSSSLISLAQGLMGSAGEGVGDGVLLLCGVETVSIVDVVVVITMAGDGRRPSLARGVGGAEVARVGESAQSNTLVAMETGLA